MYHSLTSALVLLDLVEGNLLQRTRRWPPDWLIAPSGRNIQVHCGICCDEWDSGITRDSIGSVDEVNALLVLLFKQRGRYRYPPNWFERLRYTILYTGVACDAFCGHVSSL